MTAVSLLLVLPLLALAVAGFYVRSAVLAGTGSALTGLGIFLNWVFLQFACRDSFAENCDWFDDRATWMLIAATVALGSGLLTVVGHRVAAPAGLTVAVILWLFVALGVALLPG